MTTFQEPPLQSRRAVRQSERSDQTDSAASPSANAEPLLYATQNRPVAADYDGPSLRPRRSAAPVQPAESTPTEALPQQDANGFRPRDYSPEGRRVAAPSWAPQYGSGEAAPTGAPLDYQTMNRAAVPVVVPAPRPETSAPSAEPVAEAVLSSMPPAASPVVDDSDDPAEHTLTRRELRALREANGIGPVPTDQISVAEAAAAPVVAAPPFSAPVVAAPPFFAPAIAAPTAAPTPAAAPLAAAVPPPLAEPPVTGLADPSSRLSSALAEFDVLAGARDAAPVESSAPAVGRRSAPVETTDSEPDQLSAFEALFRAPEEPRAPAAAAPAEPAAEPATEAVDPIHALLAGSTPVRAEPLALVEPAAPLRWDAPPAAAESARAPQAPATPVPAAWEAVTPQPTLATPISSSSPSSSPALASEHHAPVGHWSTQAALDDETQVGEMTISRSVGAGSGAITTSALVLPSIPTHDFGPLISTGEILVTGSIDLPRSLSSTGAHPAQLDESDLDHLLDPGDHQVSATDSSPVRAIRAVSTHTSTRGMIATGKPQGNRMFTVLIIAAAGMFVVVGTLLVVALASGVFK